MNRIVKSLIFAATGIGTICAGGPDLAQTRVECVRFYPAVGRAHCDLTDVYGLADGGFLMCGFDQIDQHRKFWVVTTDDNGDANRSQTYGNANIDAIAYTCIELENGDLAVGDGSDIGENDVEQFSYLKTNSEADLLWWRA